ncbi:hypothetical protein AAC387_Pa10g0519 [Persea americana]
MGLQNDSKAFHPGYTILLCHGMETVIPLEVGLLTLRLELGDQGLNDLNVTRELDFAEERREAARRITSSWPRDTTTRSKKEDSHWESKS